MEKSRISVAPAICRSSMIFEAAFLRTNDCTATERKIEGYVGIVVMREREIDREITVYWNCIILSDIQQ
jgi:hypothetical protein